MAEIVTFEKMDDQNEYLENTAEFLPTPLSKFFKPLSRTEAPCNNYKKKFKFSTKITFNFDHVFVSLQAKSAINLLLRLFPG